MRVPAPPDTSEILHRRGSGVFDIVGQPGYDEVAAACEQKYLHWDKVRFLARDRGLDPETVWAMVKLGRVSRFRRLPFTDTAGASMTYLLPDAVQHELMLIDQQLAGRLTLDETNVATGEQRDRFIISSLMEEAIASSKLEGAATTVRIAKDMLRRDRKPRDRSERMIANNYSAIRFIREHTGTPLSVELLLELQTLLTRDTLDHPDQVGRLRRSDERVVISDAYGEEHHVPPPASELRARLDSLCRFANEPPLDQTRFMHPVIRAIALHFQLAYDHPFCDGNGRTARALFYWSMLRSGYWLFEFLPISRLIYRSPAKYGRAFLYTETDGFDLTYFISYHMRVIRMARDDLRDYLLRKSRETAQARAAFDDAPVNARQRALLMHAADAPNTIFTIESHQNSHGVSYFTARADLLQLESLGYLARRREGRRFEFLPTERVREAMAKLNGPPPY